ncbi:SGNH/GDSL hydrolase family protein [Mesorhizobium sp.]|uniref:SGNH/GDSL hydrolase family protein n=1 Tax=Mesorhizobium sp. TaxID=1871066 RepID=UPI000FE9D734|nr:SGNH/GDSL hydrolase family protein [Mesorhizobium sp.]RWE96478.1 MAG: SGNH/GDSL hydrolase family protein [Mesorhizobium sp.]
MANEIRDAFNTVYADGPVLSPTNPDKKDIRIIGGLLQDTVDDLDTRINAVGGVPAELAALDVRLDDAETELADHETRIDNVESLITIGAKTPVAVTAISTANIAIASGVVNGATIGGAVVATGQLVVLAEQTAPAENGAYPVVAAGATARSPDFDTSAELLGATFAATDGTQAGTVWAVRNTSAITLGTTAIVITHSYGSPGNPTQAEVTTARQGESSLSANLTAMKASTSTLALLADSLAVMGGLGVSTTRLVEGSGSVSPSVYRSYSFVSGDTIEHVVVARAGERAMLQLIHTAAGAAYTANFNLEEGVVVSTSGANIVSASISALGGGWFECKAVVLVASNVTNNVQARMSAAGNLPYAGDGTSGLYIRSIILRKQGLTANLFPSSDPANAAFTKQNVTVTTTTSPNAPSLITLPDTVEELYIRAIGRMSATKLVEPSGSASPSVYQAKSVVSGDAVVWKVIAKKAERYRLNLFSNNAAIFNCTFDLENGTASGTGASIVALGNDWYECTVTVTATASASTNWQHRIFAASGTHPYVGDGASGLYVQSSKLHLNGGANLFGDSENLSTSAWTKSAGVTTVANAALYLGLLANGADIGGDPYEDGSTELIALKWAALGDSITIAGFYTSVIASQTGMVLTNLGVSGASLGQSTTAYASFGIYNQIANIPADTEVVTIAAGINDFGAQEVVLGVLGQTTTATFYGALWAAVVAIRTQAPNAKIIFFVPYSGDPTHATHRIMRTNGQGNTLDQFMRAVREVALLTSCAYLDVGGESGLGYFMPASYTSDGLHINAVGGLRYGTYCVEGLRRLSRAGYFGI